MAASLSIGGYIIKPVNGYHNTFSDWAGPVKVAGGSYGIVLLSYRWSSTYKTWSIGFGPGVSLPKIGTGSFTSGVTTLIGQPYYHDENAGYDPDVGHIVH
ncbi:hypothetical protein [Mucilaginibacter oryzae]|uniref:hypothetical protein n=1 Tax=Mucilaginibacter oryzae TaxID=468058 RepID=UPI0011B25E76|nr:hypothetical protein [Mucilaginibacter oryzae]